jgi:hypothetical protein
MTVAGGGLDDICGAIVSSIGRLATGAIRLPCATALAYCAGRGDFRSREPGRSVRVGARAGRLRRARPCLPGRRRAEPLSRHHDSNRRTRCRPWRGQAAGGRGARAAPHDRAAGRCGGQPPAQAQRQPRRWLCPVREIPPVKRASRFREVTSLEDSGLAGRFAKHFHRKPLHWALAPGPIALRPIGWPAGEDPAGAASVAGKAGRGSHGRRRQIAGGGSVPVDHEHWPVMVAGINSLIGRSPRRIGTRGGLNGREPAVWRREHTQAF